MFESTFIPFSSRIPILGFSFLSSLEAPLFRFLKEADRLGLSVATLPSSFFSAPFSRTPVVHRSTSLFFFCFPPLSSLPTSFLSSSLPSTPSSFRIPFFFFFFRETRLSSPSSSSFSISSLPTSPSSSLSFSPSHFFPI
uniref:Uncharacterized protein n=1 Tax=Opuntia streptacantha TaxID=393608 RepID=A0A7C8YQ50_OPUST